MVSNVKTACNLTNFFSLSHGKPHIYIACIIGVPSHHSPSNQTTLYHTLDPLHSPFLRYQFSIKLSCYPSSKYVPFFAMNEIILKSIRKCCLLSRDCVNSTKLASSLDGCTGGLGQGGRLSQGPGGRAPRE